MKHHWLALRSACAAALLALATAASAQPLPSGIALGMHVSELRQAVPELRRVPRPARLAGGLVGSWSGPDIDIAGTTMVPTFYFAGDVLQRVEYANAGPTPDPAFDSLLAWGRTQWGQELASSSPEASYATWTREDMSVYLQKTLPPQRPSVRLVFKRIVAVDASTL